jgi:hypothetical protein
VAAETVDDGSGSEDKEQKHRHPDTIGDVAGVDDPRDSYRQTSKRIRQCKEFTAPTKIEHGLAQTPCRSRGVTSGEAESVKTQPFRQEIAPTTPPGLPSPISTRAPKLGRIPVLPWYLALDRRCRCSRRGSIWRGIAVMRALSHRVKIADRKQAYRGFASLLTGGRRLTHQRCARNPRWLDVSGAQTEDRSTHSHSWLAG